MNRFRLSILVLSCLVIAGCQAVLPVSSHTVGNSEFSELHGEVSAMANAPRLVAPIDARIAAVGGSSPLSYTFVEAGAMKYNVDRLNGLSATDTDVDKYYGRASLGLGLFHVFAGYENQQLDLQNTSSDLLRLGAGAHIELSEDFHAVGEAAWLYNDVSSDLAGFASSKSGYEVRAGVRWLAMNWEAGGLELDGNLLWVNLDNGLASKDEAVGWEAGLRIHLFQMFSAGAMYTIVEDDDQIGVSARLSF